MTDRKYEPLHEVTMYQARCTNCGTVETEYGDFSAWGDPDTPRNDVVENCEWFERWVVDSRENGKVESHLEELLCPECQKCAVCGADNARDVNDGEHLVCGDHEDHDFSAVRA